MEHDRAYRRHHLWRIVKKRRQHLHYTSETPDGWLAKNNFAHGKCGVCNPDRKFGKPKAKYRIKHKRRYFERMYDNDYVFGTQTRFINAF